VQMRIAMSHLLRFELLPDQDFSSDGGAHADDEGWAVVAGEQDVGCK
jgi:hypothetical protein